MGLPFLHRQARKRDQIVAVDLGGRLTKAVHVQYKADQFALTSFTIQEAPAYEKNLSGEVLGNHLKAVTGALGDRTRFVTLALGVSDTIVRHAELPPMAVAEMRQMLKFNSKGYLQQELPDFTFDCSIILPRQPAAGDPKNTGNSKLKVLVGGARRQLLEEVQAATRQAGLLAEQVLPGMIGPPNAFELAEPEIFPKDVVALVDIGFKNTTITILQKGELVMNRVVALGGDRITAGLAESLGISYAEAESIKIGMPNEVQSTLEPLVIPLGRELRASIDFFEHQQDTTVSQVFISGSSARSELIVQALQSELMTPCKTWNPAKSLRLELSPAQAAELEQVAPQLTVALGAAAAAF